MTCSLRSVFVQFYCLPIRDILALFAVATWGFFWLDRRFRKALLWKVLLFLVFAAFTGVIIHLTVSQREGGAINTLVLTPFHSYREVMNGGNPEIYRSNFMNAVLFYPAGLLATVLLPEKWPGWCRCVLVVILSGAMSAGIEYAQYFWQLGRVEIDDVIHNTAGALAGSLAVLCIPPVLGRIGNKMKHLWAWYARRQT